MQDGSSVVGVVVAVVWHGIHLLIIISIAETDLSSVDDVALVILFAARSSLSVALLASSDFQLLSKFANHANKPKC